MHYVYLVDTKTEVQHANSKLKEELEIFMSHSIDSQRSMSDSAAKCLSDGFGS